MSQQEQLSPLPPAASAPAIQAKPTQPPASSLWSRLAVPLFAVIVALAFVAVATLRFNEWVGDAAIQTTNDAYVRSDLTRLSSRVAGEVLTAAVDDFQRVKAGDLLVLNANPLTDIRNTRQIHSVWIGGRRLATMPAVTTARR